MLGSIRKFSTSIYAKILLSIVVIPFVFWGMGTSFSGGNKNVIVVIDDEKVSTQEFANFVNSYQYSKEKISPDKMDELLTIFIGNKLIEKEYNQFNILLTDLSLSKLIKIQKKFKRDGKFSRAEYEKFLISNNLDPVSFEKNLSIQEKKKQLLNIIGGGIVPSKFTLDNVYNKINQKRKIELLNLNDAFINKITFEEEQIKTYYENNKDRYVEIFKSIKILEITPKMLNGTNDFNDIFFEKLDEIHDLTIQGEDLDSLTKIYNLDNTDTVKINRLGQGPDYNVINNFPKDLINDIFLKTNDNIAHFLEKSNKFYLYQIFKSEKILKVLDNESVMNDVKLNLKILEKRKLMSNLISKINSKQYDKTDFDKLSKEKNVAVQQIILNNLNDNKSLKQEVVSQIYKFPEKKVSLVYDTELTENYLVYISKVTNTSINSNSKEYEKYFKLSKIDIANGIFNTYDKYIKDKYKIDINYKALNNLKSYIN